MPTILAPTSGFVDIYEKGFNRMILINRLTIVSTCDLPAEDGRFLNDGDGGLRRYARMAFN